MGKLALGGVWSALVQQGLQLLRLLVTEQRKTNTLLERNNELLEKVLQRQ